MKRILHHFYHDLGRQRYELAAWGCVLLAYGVIWSLVVRPGVAREVLALAPMAQALVILFGLKQAAGVVLADAPVSPAAFWVTRPLRGGELYGAKLLFVGTLVILPWLLVEIGVLVAIGHGGEAGLMVGEFVANRWHWLALVIALATLSARGIHLFAWAGAVLVLGIAQAFLIRLVVGDGGRFGADVPGLADTKLVVAFVVAGLVWLGAGWHQYARRRTAVSAGLVLVGIAAGCGVYLAWGWDFLTPRSEESLAAAGAGQLAVDLGAEPLRLSNLTVTRGDRETEYLRVVGRVDVNGLQPGFTADVAWLDGRFLPVGGGEMRPDMPSQGHRLSSIDEPALAAALGGVTFLSSQGGVIHNWIDLLTLERSRFESLRTARGNYRADLNLNVFQYVIRAELPLREGAGWRGPGYAVDIRGLAPQEVQVTHSDGERTEHLTEVQGLRLRLFERHAEWAMGGSNPDWVHPGGPRATRYRLVLWNKARREALLPHRGSGTIAGASPLRCLDWELPFTVGSGRGKLPEGWLDGAVLAVVEKRFAGAVPARLERADVTFGDAR